MNRPGVPIFLTATVIALLSCAGVASAATPTSPAGTTYEGKLHASSEGHMVIDNPIAPIQCSSTLEGEVKGSAFGEPVSIPLSSLAFSGCTNSWHVTVVSPGTLEVHAVAGGKNGTVTWSGATIEATRFGVTCRYKTEATDVGTLTASKATGGTATIDLSGTLPLYSPSSFLCEEGPPHSLTGSYSVGTPDYLDIDDEDGATPTSPAGTTYEGKFHASSEGHVTIHAENARLECASTLEGKVEESGFDEPLSIPLSSVTFSGCTNSWHVTVASPGTLEVHASAGNNGTVTWSGATIEGTRFGVSCRYKTENTDVGTVTASKATAGTATIDLSGTLPFHGGSFLCGEKATPFTGNYTVVTPDYLDVDSEPTATPTSPAGTTYEGKFHASSEGHVTIHAENAKLECASTLEGKVEESGFGEPVSIPFSSLTFTGCTNSWHVTVVSPGTLEVHATGTSKNGIATWSGATIEGTRFGVSCRYVTNETAIGTLTASKATGGTATIDLSGTLPFHSGSFLCGEKATPFTGSYTVGTPDYLDIDS